jgi:hypothetical protein
MARDEDDEDMPHTPLRDYFTTFLGLDFDIDRQLQAIRTMLNRNALAEDALEAEVTAADNAAQRGDAYAERAIDEWTDLLEESTYQAAAHSLSAVGMLAPLYETVFHRGFDGIGRKVFNFGNPTTKHKRWELVDNRRWDCRYVGKRKANEHGEIVEVWQRHVLAGITQLTEAAQLSLPDRCVDTITALFNYRNTMFHRGMEWEEQDVDKLAATMRPADWSSWFNQFGRFCIMTPHFVDQCLQLIEGVLEAFGDLMTRYPLWRRALNFSLASDPCITYDDTIVIEDFF